jgi:Uma2 family endonuclease
MGPTDLDLNTRGLRRVEYESLVELGMFHGERLELLDGVLVVREPHGGLHATTLTQIVQRLTSLCPSGSHVRCQLPLALDDASEPEPDVAIVAGAPFDYIDGHPPMATLVVEVADSSLRLDRGLKAGLYARARVPEYWIVNVVDLVVEVHRAPEAAPEGVYGAVYRSVDILRPPATIAPLAAPDAHIPVADLLPPAR